MNYWCRQPQEPQVGPGYFLWASEASVPTELHSQFKFRCLHLTAVNICDCRLGNKVSLGVRRGPEWYEDTQALVAQSQAHPGLCFAMLGLGLCHATFLCQLAPCNILLGLQWSLKEPCWELTPISELSEGAFMLSKSTELDTWTSAVLLPGLCSISTTLGPQTLPYELQTHLGYWGGLAHFRGFRQC